MKYTKQMTILLATAITVSLCQPNVDTSAASVKLSKSKIEIKQGQTATLKVKGTKKKAKWSIKSGKKYIKLQKKRKASVRIKAVKPGTAKVQCKVGKKKLVCKVTVRAKNKKKNIRTTQQPILQSTAQPTATPMVNIEPTGVPIRTHAPTEDRLMREPMEDEFGVRGMVGGGVTNAGYYYFYDSPILRQDIELLSFLDKIEIPENIIGSMDLSEKQNKSVMSWYTDHDADGLYEVVIAQEGGVVANPDSSFLFCDVGWINGLEHLYTSGVTDMSYMFYYFGYPFKGDSGEKYLNLGDNFDTSSVEDMTYMFRDVAPVQQLRIRLGVAFSTDNVKQATGALRQPAKGEYTIVAPNEKVYNWFVRLLDHVEATVTDIELEVQEDK